MVDRVDVSSVLMQMRQVREQMRVQNEQAIPQGRQDIAKDAISRIAEQAEQANSISSISGDNTVPDFQTMFKNAIDNVNENQQTASQLATRFEQGDPSIDLPEVMIALQKSSVSFQAMTQVRNKLVEAYKDVMNMPV
ncbi:MAG: flagellar hook-basal body complex protein FliE [Thalassolituus sp.]